MADSASESYLQSDTSSLKHISSSLFSIPGFFVGFGAKCSSESDSVRSPTSPLDFKVFSNLSSPFSLRSPRSQAQCGHQKKWDCSEVGLGILNSLVNESKPLGEVLDSPKRKNIIFGPQVKTHIHSTSKYYHKSLDSSVKSNSLPRNYVFLPLAQARTLNPQLGSTNVAFRSEEFPLESEPIKHIPSCLSDSTRLSSSQIGLNDDPSLSFISFPSKNKTTIMSSPPVTGRGSLVENSLGNRSSSLPIPIGSSHGDIGSLSAREIELSEDYTCIISHGPNPKTIHIFGDCVLECHTNELTNFGKKEESVTECPRVDTHPKGSTPYRSDEILSFCYSCKKKLEEGIDIYIYRGEKAFCSFECRSEEIFAEESEKSYNNSFESSPESSYHEDMFLMGMPFAE